MKYHELLMPPNENAVRDKKPVLLSVLLHLVLLLIIVMMSPSAHISGHDVLLVTLQSESSFTVGFHRPDVRTHAPLTVKPVRGNRAVAALPASTVDPIQRISQPVNKEVVIREPAISGDMPREQEDEAGRTSAISKTQGFTSGSSMTGMGDGKTTEGNTVSPAETRFGDRGAPAFVYQEIPVYPALARRLGMEGRVLLKLLIDADGKLLNVEVIESAGYGFTEASIEAVKKSTYAPGVRDGVKVATLALLPVRFRLQ